MLSGQPPLLPRPLTVNPAPLCLLFRPPRANNHLFFFKQKTAYEFTRLLEFRRVLFRSMKLCEDRRGTYKKTEYIGATRVMLQYEMPLAEVIYDFYDRLKSSTKGYGTMDYDVIGFRHGELVKMDILVNGDRVDALSVIVHRDHAEARGRKLLVRLEEEINGRLSDITLQAAIGGKTIARETIKSVGKNVTAKCYGGDVTRKRKLLEKQKEGKKRMKRVGSVDIPQEAFMAILESGD